MVKSLLWLLLALLTFCSSAKSQDVVHFVAEDLPPYHYVNESGEPDGARVELARAVASQAGINAVVEIMPMARVLHEFETKTNVALLSWLKTPARAANFRFLGTMAHAEASLIGLTTLNKPITTLAEAKAYRTGTIRGYYSEQFLKQHGFNEGYELVLVSDHERLWQLLYKGRIDFVFTNSLSLQKELQTLSLDAEKIEQKLVLTRFPNELALSVNSHFSEPLAARIEAALKTLASDGTQQQILTRWRVQ